MAVPRDSAVSVADDTAAGLALRAGCFCDNTSAATLPTAEPALGPRSAGAPTGLLIAGALAGLLWASEVVGAVLRTVQPMRSTSVGVSTSARSAHAASFPQAADLAPCGGTSACSQAPAEALPGTGPLSTDGSEQQANCGGASGSSFGTTAGGWPRGTSFRPEGPSQVVTEGSAPDGAPTASAAHGRGWSDGPASPPPIVGERRRPPSAPPLRRRGRVLATVAFGRKGSRISTALSGWAVCEWVASPLFAARSTILACAGAFPGRTRPS